MPKPHTDTPSVHDSVGYWASHLARAMEAAFNARLSEHGLNRSSYAVLAALVFDQRSTPSQIADFLGLDRASVTRLLDKLENQALILRNRDGSDRRSVSVMAQSKGIALAHQLVTDSQAVNTQFTAGLTPAEVAQFVATARKMLTNGDATLDML